MTRASFWLTFLSVWNNFLRLFGYRPEHERSVRLNDEQHEPPAATDGAHSTEHPQPQQPQQPQQPYRPPPEAVNPLPQPEAVRTGPLLAIVRHSKRLDASGHDGIAPEQWPDQRARPYDTPIGDHELPRVAAAQLRAQGLASFDVIVSSPYRRCLQTAGLLAQELHIGHLVIDNRLGEDLNAAERCWAAAGLAVGEYTYVSEAEAARWAKVDASGGGGLTRVTWLRDEHPVLAPPDSVPDRVAQLPQICRAAASAVGALPAEAAVLAVTHGDLVNCFAPSFDWAPDIGRYRADECGWLACRGFEPLAGYEGDTVPLEQVPRVLGSEGLSPM